MQLQESKKKELSWLEDQLKALNFKFNNMESRKERISIIGKIINCECKIINLQKS